MKDINYLHQKFNATAEGDGKGSIETYQNWLERQLLARIERLEQLDLHVVGKSLKVDIQHFDLTDCPYQINTFLKKYKIEKDHIISFSRSDKYLTMVYQTF